MDRDIQAVFAAIGSFFIITLLLVAAILFCQHCKTTKSRPAAAGRSNLDPSETPTPAPPSPYSTPAGPENPNLKISMEELSRATENFSPRLIVGDGSFGLVYKARLSTGAVVAVKKLSPDALQGFREFAAEMETLSKLGHRNIVKILGYWASGPERLLVYEFIEKGNLDQWLHGHSSNDDVFRCFPLTWVHRVNIMRGVAHGLCYLHGLDKPIIHRDIKASNVLLDSEFQAHIADFGLARRIDTLHSHVSTQFAGTIGYMPPEYRDGVLVANKKVDVYSFGVLMMETASGHRPNLAVRFDGVDIGLVQWARKMKEQGAEMKMVDEKISRDEEGLREESVKEYIRIACMCAGELQKERPQMVEVVKLLESMPL